MDLDSVECVSSYDGLEEETSHLHLPFSKSHGGAAIDAAAQAQGISPATSIHELLECPVCTNSMYPPIHQCPNGHTLCLTCKTRVQNRCPTCRQELGDIRFRLLGYGDIPFLVDHLRDDHKVDMHTGCTFNHRYVKSNPREVENATWMLTVFHCFGQYFCLHFEAFQLGMAPVYMAFLRFMGDESEARNYSYSLEVGGNGRKLIWKEHPGAYVTAIARKELKLRVTGRIWKEQQNSESGMCIPNLNT
ncbi:hypothetical protein HPP92_001221 [Vanilla planifolia]|uniref:RING-type domain-containing protein n=1 Tax=Vanilla planifolia TaxID=51239 RepID=A0A835S479_VANPL|nr:hypothetical protein HPP92_001221 [Vanilla planifolia]